MAARAAFLELSPLTSPASPRPCTLHALNTLSYFQFPWMRHAASGLRPQHLLCSLPVLPPLPLPGSFLLILEVYT